MFFFFFTKTFHKYNTYFITFLSKPYSSKLSNSIRRQALIRILKSSLGEQIMIMIPLAFSPLKSSIIDLFIQIYIFSQVRPAGLTTFTRTFSEKQVLSKSSSKCTHTLRGTALKPSRCL